MRFCGVVLPFLFFSSALSAATLASAVDHILSRQREFEDIVVFSPLETGPDAVAFTDELVSVPEPLQMDPAPPARRVSPLKIRTLFDTQADTVKKRVLVKKNGETIAFTMSLDNGGAPYRQTVHEGKFPVFYREGETLVYLQGKTQSGEVVTKEWAYTEKPNVPAGSRYVWRFESGSSNYRVAVKRESDGSVGIYKRMIVLGVDSKDAANQKSVMDTVRKAFKSSISIRDEEFITRIPQAVYWTAAGERKSARYEVVDVETLVVLVDEAGENYPLTIDPSLRYGQWLGADVGQAEINCVALSTSTGELYVGGTSYGVMDESVTFQGGFPLGNVSDGFVVEIQTGTTPTLNWGQWLGGDYIDKVTSLAVNGDEIYAGGYSGGTTSWESVTFQGSHSGGNEGFVVEIADGATPTLNWGQWLGGTGAEEVKALAVNGDEIYAGGYSQSTTSWESVTFQGTHSASNEGFVVEIEDGGTPTLNWGQWLGGTGADEVHTLAVNGDEIYAGGYSGSTGSWETVTFQGSHSGGSEGFVVEIADGSTPTLNWGQWLGGTGGDVVSALAVNGDEIYAGGYSGGTTSWESVTFQGSHSGSNEGFVVEIADGSTPTLNWGQWFGGTSVDYVTTLAVNGDEIYAGGYTLSTTSWESVTFQGSFSGSNEGFVVEIADGSTPTLNWGQWLGGNQIDQLNALVIDGDNIYVAGLSVSSTSWESVTIQGEFGTASYNEGIVIAISDGATPALNWGQWLGGGKDEENINAIAVDGNEIYVAGSSSNPNAWESVTFQGSHSGSNEGFVVEIGDGATPTLNWGQWLGGTSDDSVYALAVNGDEIYAAGYSAGTTSWESVTFQGSHSGSNEGFVVEIGDGATPTLNWGQWLGGTGADEVKALAVNGDEIYAGGYTLSTTSWESVTFQGSFSGTSEGFVVEIADGSSPTLNWGQWLGGLNSDSVDALAVTGDEIYAAGFSDDSDWESVTFQGTFEMGSSQGFVVEIADGSSPTLNWGQWLGGDTANGIYALAVNGDEIYAGGYSNSEFSWESVTFQGAHNNGGYLEGFVVEIADGTTPTLNWGQWLGGVNDTIVFALAVYGDEIYAAGTSLDPTGWESVTFQGSHSGDNEGFVVEIADGTTPTLNWGQWLGGSTADEVASVGINADKIYAGGSTNSPVSWENVTFQGGNGGTTEAFLIGISDDVGGAAPQIFFGTQF